LHIIPVTDKQVISALRSNTYFEDLDHGTLGELSAGTELLRFDRGEVLFWGNDPCRGLYIT